MAATEPREPRPKGLTTFRGNASRSFYGLGPAPLAPQVMWTYPSSGGMCAESSEGEETKTWCGTGWTGQPNVVQRGDRRMVIFGAYDRNVHVVDGFTGEPLYAPFATGDIIKGTVTTDPDGYPIVYSGSRDGYFRALDISHPPTITELWSLPASSAPQPMWNDDWDGSALVIDGHLLVGGENSWFYVVKLNRSYTPDGVATIDPEVVAMVPGFDDELLSDLGDTQVSIENSVAYRDGVVYFTNSGGLVQGWNIERVLAGSGKPKRVLRFWAGDDTDASIVIDREGFLYVAAEADRGTQRSIELGQLMKLDPRNPEDPLVWSLQIPGAGGLAGGVWSTPAIHRGRLFVTTNSGRLMMLDQTDGTILWETALPGPLWSSPAVVRDVLVVGDCSGVLHAFDVRPRLDIPADLWSVGLSGCIESTPAIWKGWIYVGTRGGAVYGIADP